MEIKKLKEAIKNLEYSVGNMCGDSLISCTKSVFVSVLENYKELLKYKEQETKKKGKNISNMHYSDEFQCSECGFTCDGLVEKIWDEDGEYYSYYAYECKFCPNCGSPLEEQ